MELGQIRGEAVIVAGIGSRKGVSATEVVAAIEATLKEHGLTKAALSLLATARMKRDEAGIIAAGAALNVPLILVDDEVLRDMSAKTLSHSDASLAAAGVGSVSEAAALAAAGEGARLARPRIAVGAVTCALAFGGDI
ncbi:cobalamin biosynthesis protein [Mesorhizobium sp. KR9-304]|uniref:cobalamin biosynthesis protein n=1 Tax=Mesorhizobium sp. KR9-304 TaxID=3156614 RepID=UPI0032B5B29F